MNMPRTRHTGVALAFGTALISGVSIYLNGLVVEEFNDPLLLAGVRNSLVGLVLLGLLLATSPRSEIAGLGGRQRAGLLTLAVVGGSIPFLLFFGGLAATGAPGAAFIHKTLFAWVAVLAVPLLGESLGWIQMAALTGLLVGSALLTPPTGVGPGLGEAMILAATLLWAVEVIVARRLLPGVSVRLAATSRMALGAVLMLAFLGLDGRLGGVAEFTLRHWLVVGLTGILLLGYVTTWYGALQRAPATTVTSILVAGTVVTGLLQAVGSGALPPVMQATGLAIVVVAVALLGWLALAAPARRMAEHA